MKTMELRGKIGVVGMKKNRRFFQTTVKFGEIRHFVERRLYNGATGKGEQRAIVPANVTRLTKAIREDNYTPTSWSLSLKKEHLEAAVIDDSGNITVTVSEDSPVPIMDGGHRDTSYERIYEEIEKSLEDASDRSALELIENQDVPLVVYLDGDPKTDFLNLNSGKAIDSAHLLSLQIRRGEVKGQDKDSLKFGLEVAKLMSSDKPEKSWLTNYILFDSRKDKAPKLAMPITTVLGRGSSDIACSMVGGARLAIEFDRDAAWLAAVYKTVYDKILSDAPELLKPDRVLTPPPDGTKGGATLLLGIGNCVAYYMGRRDTNALSDDEVESLITAVKHNFDVPARGNTSADKKRQAIGSFAMEYFAEYNAEEEEATHEGIPMGLVTSLSAGTFGVSKLPKKTGAA